MVDEFNGVRPENQIRAVIDKHVVKPAEKLRLKAEDLLYQNQVDAAYEVLQEANQIDPANSEVLVDIARIKVLRRESDEAQTILDALPVEVGLRPEVKQLKAQLQFTRNDELPSTDLLMQRLEANPDDHQARFDLAQRAVQGDSVEQAMEFLLDILARDRQWNDGAAKARLIQLFDLLGAADPRVAQYRRKLYALLH